MIPIFSSEYSIGKSILSLEDDKELDESKLVSIVSIAKKHNLKEVYLADESMSGFVKAHQNLSKHGINLRFGYKVTVCSDIKDKTEEGMNTESKVIIWGLNSEAYKDLVKIATFAECKGFYYIPRIDWNYLNEVYNPNLLVSIPFYDSFLHKNTMNFSRCVPKFINFNPVLEISKAGLPFDSIIEGKIKEYNESNKYQTIDTHPIYYYKYDDFLAYSVYRCINKRSTMDCPNLEHFSSNEFCFEAYLNYGNR